MDTKMIYIADDEPAIRELIRSFLEEEGFRVKTFATGDELLSAFLSESCDLVILDIMMPGTDGLSICRTLRKQSQVPIILLTARDSDADYITGFTLGCDDYFTKPFSPVKLTMRVKAMFRRIAPESIDSAAKEVCYGDIRLLPKQKVAYCREEMLKLTNTEYSLLLYLITNNDRAVSRDELLHQLWGYESDVETRVTDDTIKRLRKKIREVQSIIAIETVWGFGFKLTKEG